MRVIRGNIPIWKGSSYAITIGCVTAVFENGIILSGPSPNHNVDFQAGARERREKWSPTNCGQQSAQLQLLVRSFLGLQPFKYPGHLNIFSPQKSLVTFFSISQCLQSIKVSSLPLWR